MSIAVQVRERDLGRPVTNADPDRRSRRESARTVAEQDRNAPVLLPDGQREVDVAVTVQVDGDHLRWAAAHPARMAGRETARAVPDQNPDLVRSLVGNDEIRLAVSVHVRRRNPGRTVADDDGRASGRVEAASAVSEQHREVIGPVVPDGEVHVAVAVEVRDCERIGKTADRKSSARRVRRISGSCSSHQHQRKQSCLRCEGPDAAKPHDRSNLRLGCCECVSARQGNESRAYAAAPVRRPQARRLRL